MKFERFIASRILKKDRDNFSRPIIRISTVAVALGIAIMLMAVSIVTGFQKEVSHKVTGFASHIRVVSYDNNKSWEVNAIPREQDFVPKLNKDEGIKHIQVFGLKAGIMKHDEQILGTILKGVENDFNWKFIEKSLAKGDTLKLQDSVKSDKIIISKYHADKLRLDTGESVLMYFVEDPPRYRKFDIAGIYKSGLQEMDRRFVLCDLRHVQSLNNWNENQIAGYEIFLKDLSELQEYTEKIYETTGFNLKVKNIRMLYPQIMDWLNMLDTNVIVILTLMLLVSAITMVSTLLILILEKTNMIGILKAMGTKDKSIRKVFIFNALHIIGRGMFWGNFIGLGILLIQKLTGIITLDESTYYMAVAPVNFDLLHILMVNAGTILICFLFLLMPSYLITKISPVNAIKFD